ncbi:MAG TPA: hypothetical protein VMS73_07395 [Anaerolineaceae bacterium]|nr:hypothetical protein [Anaerolineaceae bacterium]
MADFNKFELVLLLKPLLGMKNVPWVLCGLILAIFDRNMQDWMQEHEDEISVHDAVMEALKEEGEENMISPIFSNRPESLSKLG